MILFIAKLFLPSWNFFNDFTASTQFDYAIVDSEEHEAAGRWLPLFETPAGHPWIRLLFNPWGNHDLFEFSAMEQAAESLSESRRPGFGFDCIDLGSEESHRWHSLISIHPAYARIVFLMQNRLSRRMPENHPAREAQFRFRVTLAPDGENMPGWSLVSDKHPLHPVPERPSPTCGIPSPGNR